MDHWYARAATRHKDRLQGHTSRRAGCEWLLIVLGIFAIIIVVLFTKGCSSEPYLDVVAEKSSEDVSAAPTFVKSSSGRIAFHSDRDGDNEIYVMNADGNGVEQMTFNDSSDCCPAWSPDASRIAFRSDRDNTSHVHHIYLMNADGNGVQQITHGADSNHLAWSPNGDHIAFVSYSEIYVINVDGTGVVRLTSNNTTHGRSVFFLDRDGDGLGEPYVRNDDGSVESFSDWESIDFESIDWLPSWSPDSQRIAFVSFRDRDPEIYVMNADGSGVVQLTDNTFDFDTDPSWSPDGARIAFVSDRDGKDDEIYVMNVDGGGIKRITDNEYPDSLPKWATDGERIAFSSFRNGDMGIYIMNADGSNVTRLTDGYSPAWSPAVD